MAELQQISLGKLVNNTGQIAGVPKNPRQIRNEQYDKLLQSLKESDLTDYKPLMVYPQGGKFVVLGGNMRLRALRELKAETVSCIIVPEGTPAETLRKLVIIDNTEFGEYDWDAVANEWDADALSDWGVETPWGGETKEESEAEMIARKEQEFRERMERGELSEEDDEYQEFLEKFKLKKTTDDCYTPAIVYDAVADYVARTYNVNRSNFVRPFYPGGDYKSEKYPAGCVVVDNPPFSILAEILNFYMERGVAFFLFAPTLTLFSSAAAAAALPCGVAITYENGASVNTSFLTSFEAYTYWIKSAPELYAVVKAANDENLKQQKKQLPKYAYPPELVTSPGVAIYSRLGIDFVVPKSESYRVSRLDEQKERGDKAVYGKGYLVSRRVCAERERAERVRAERERAERERAERWTLSAREEAIVESLSKGGAE